MCIYIYMCIDIYSHSGLCDQHGNRHKVLSRAQCSILHVFSLAFSCSREPCQGPGGSFTMMNMPYDACEKNSDCRVTALCLPTKQNHNCARTSCELGRLSMTMPCRRWLPAPHANGEFHTVQLRDLRTGPSTYCECPLSFSTLPDR
jgi:hypothetical protein